jgi:hypothetical protein
MGKQIGCIGAATHGFMDYGHDTKKLAAHAVASSGFKLEFFKWGVSLWDIHNEFKVEGADGHVNAYANFFDVKKMKVKKLYSYKKGPYKFNVKGNSCKADQKTTWRQSKAIKKQFFKLEVCYGIPKIASVCGAVILDGTLGFHYGVGLIAPAYDAILMNFEPHAGLNLRLEISGQALGFKASIMGTMSPLKANLPASAMYAFKKRKGGVSLKWSVKLMELSMDAHLKRPGLKKCEEDDLGNPIQGKTSPLPIKTWRGSTVKMLGDKSHTIEYPAEQDMLSLDDAMIKPLGEGAKVRWLGKVGKWVKKGVKAVKKVAKKVVAVAKKLCRIPCVACENMPGFPKKLAKVDGKSLGGTILEKNAC